ncbi:F-box protein At4g00755-like [Nicotiana sylvestris]|uniref:F-box protein At4g00755-like n=1 Tax=Nicotiana sylvestris TaxID=4096 RepID=A0A1U7VC09_NICSY|nr:PREDICTED: F-box protein At4g00755-like [Nicotiana sylvestris]XP_009763907.1 PREDICTED: F-box protein At4g00755-like [Nicotiana sylvestris]XP_009763908.1 PREDICTED: F-box protein At4g00755-like [Nicotiana sylvestris]
MERCGDFVQWFLPDMSIKILMCLEDPSDLVRVSAVSTSWRQFVIGNGLCKHLCLRRFPEISSVANMVEVKNTITPVVSQRRLELLCLEWDHRVYAFLAQGLSNCTRKDCLIDAILASSTDNYPEESILNTLEPSDQVGRRASYWSSRGESDPAVPETLTYKLISKLCLISEFHVQPFQAYFQFGFPIYSAKAVRFRVGHSNVKIDVESDNGHESAAAQGSLLDNIIWTYTSPVFPMEQENSLQKFKLPEPVLCIGGVLQLELLGRVQRQEMDGQYYICVSHVQVVGRPLLPAFDVSILDESGKWTLKYYPKENLSQSRTKFSEGESSSPRLRSFGSNLRGWEQMILNTLLGAGAVVVDEEYDV